MPFTARLYDAPSPAPAMPRSRTHLTAGFSHAASQLHHVVVHNLSPQGVLIESYHPLDIGAEVSLDIAGVGEMSARVAWRDGIFYDCLFETPLAPERVRAKLTSTKVVWGNFPSHRPASVPADRPITFFQEEAPHPVAHEGRLPAGARIACIVGAAALCWTPPAGFIFLLIQ